MISRDGLHNDAHLLLGLGLENQALGRFFMAQGICFAVADAQTDAAARWQAAWGDRVTAWHLGPDYLAHLDGYTRIWRTPGIPVLHPALQSVQRRGVRLDSQTRLFFARTPAPVLGVTGTKGKGTTTMLLAAALAAGPFARVYVGGNIGTPPIAFLHELGARDLALLELSSFQLQDLDRSPQIGVVLRITEDHLDYHADRAEYIRAKQAICRHQSAADWLVFNQDCPQGRAFARASKAHQLSFSRSRECAAGAWAGAGHLWLRHPEGMREAVCRLEEIPLRGGHNCENAAAAAAAALAAGASTAQIGAGLRAFEGLPHRLEFVGTVDNVQYYNDSLGTTPDAAMAALQAFSQPVVLIVGGASKGADFSGLAHQICSRDVRAVVLLGEEGPRIHAAIKAQRRFNGLIIEGMGSMDAAVTQASQQAQPGDVVLLSPACASFGLFTDYRDRGEQFKQAVLGLDALG